jgi:putative transposase
MTSYRRLRIHGATYFFTLCLNARGDTALTDHIGLLRQAYRVTTLELPVTCHAFVVLPDHLHAIWTEPASGVFYSERWRRIKAQFSHALPPMSTPSRSHMAKRERGIWQRRFWEHCIRDEQGFEAAMRYCHDSPVKHGLVSDPDDWPYSSFAKAKMGRLPILQGQAMTIPL